MSGAEVLVVGVHGHPVVAAHLVTAVHVVPHLHLRLSRLLIEVLHLTIIGRIIVLAVIVRRTVVPVGMPVEGVVGLVLVGQRIAGRGSVRRRRRCDDAAGVAAQGSEVPVGLIVRHLR